VAVTLWSAWALGLAAFAVPAGWSMAQDKPTDKCVFEGTARNSLTKLAVGKAIIRLIPLDGSVGYAGSSNAIGAFRFEGIAAGEYEIEAHRTGYTARWVLSDSAGHAIPALHLAPGQTLGGNDLWFTPESSVSGKVLGPDGEPLPGARVTLIVRKWRRGKRIYAGAYGETANDSGEYRFPEVAPGRYLVYAARPTEGPLAFSIREAPDKPETRIDGRYHPNAAQLDGAAAVDVKGGDEISGIDFQLPLASVFHFTGKAPPPTGEETAGVVLNPRYNDQMLDWAGVGAAVGPDGAFDIVGVRPGSYFLNAFQLIQHDRLMSGRLPVVVTAQDSSGAAAPLVQRFELKGRVRVEGKAAGEAVPVQIFCEGSEADDYTSFQRRAEPKGDGTFAIKDLTPDKYTVHVVNMETEKEGGYYLKSVRVNGVPVASREIDLSGAAVDDVELVLSAAVGGVEGTLKWPEESSSSHAIPEPPGELTVVIVPEKVASGDCAPQTAYLDQDGHFRVTDLEPGNYRLFAVTAYDQGLWQNAQFLRLIAGRGTEVEIAEKGNAKAEVQVLRAADLRAVEDRIE
jgi:hypothetical protein